MTDFYQVEKQKGYEFIWYVMVVYYYFIWKVHKDLWYESTSMLEGFVFQYGNVSI